MFVLETNNYLVIVVTGYQRHCDYTEANNGRSSKPASKLSNAICIICSRVDCAALPICDFHFLKNKKLIGQQPEKLEEKKER
ncbi:hypothetical protein DERP_008737 [Dermatophagoides pteronyssinus]|uniref:Uncharacterized protein n=1 Tax=Dermatophagoides pteronyssinus TaxID=6956 RepID=A0ABQ8IW90_DERPT|nr:hypothetical protein DERP_008737 [Dermatophagoides pteronyssinus]